MQIHTCRICDGKGTLKVKRRGFSRKYYVKCHDCKAETIQTRTPEIATSEWNDGWVFGGKLNAL